MALANAVTITSIVAASTGPAIRMSVPVANLISMAPGVSGIAIASPNPTSTRSRDKCIAAKRKASTPPINSLNLAGRPCARLVAIGRAGAAVGTSVTKVGVTNR